MSVDQLREQLREEAIKVLQKEWNKEKAREIFALRCHFRKEREEERNKHEKLVNFVKFAYREITRLIIEGGGDGDGNEARNQEELPTTEEEMVAVFKRKICKLWGVFRKLEKRNETLKSKLMETNRGILRLVEKCQEKGKRQVAAAQPGSSGCNSSVGNVETHEEEEVEDEENQVVDVESVEPHAEEVGNIELPEGEVDNVETPEEEVDNGKLQEEEVGNGEHQEFVVFELDKVTDEANHTSDPETETLVNPMSQPQQQRSRSSQHVNEGYDEDDDVIIIEPDAPQETEIQSQPLCSTPPKIKLDPCGILRPPHKRHLLDVTKRGLNRFYCTCGIKFTSRAKLGPHIKFWKGGYLHYYRGLFSCDLCDIRFPGFCTLKKHKRIKHNIVDPRFQIGCRRCGIIFSSRSDFSRHWRSVHVHPISSTTATSPQPSTSSVMCGSTTSKNLGSISSKKTAKPVHKIKIVE